MLTKLLASKLTRVFLFVLCLVPAARLAYGLYRAAQGDIDGPLAANPIEYITRSTGDWTIRFLLISLVITPLRFLANAPRFTTYRRMLGLFAFFYGVAHLMTWVWLDKFFDLPEMISDVFKRPFITVGMLGFSFMLPLAATSTAWAVRKLGYAKWQKLHRIVYLSPAAGVMHYLWLVKSDIRMPLLYGAILAALMAYRVYLWTRPSKAAVRRPVVAQQAD
jgi:sulfoxide reductase heme-binding subunit YedZ